jgi:hypothetical protein
MMMMLTIWRHGWSVVHGDDERDILVDRLIIVE